MDDSDFESSGWTRPLTPSHYPGFVRYCLRAVRKESEDLINTFIRTDGLTLQAVAFTLRTASGRVSHVVTRPVAAAFMILTGHVRLSVTRPGPNDLVHILNCINIDQS